MNAFIVHEELLGNEFTLRDSFFVSLLEDKEMSFSEPLKSLDSD